MSDYFDQISEKRAPNVKQFLRGVKNYHVLSQYTKVSSFSAFIFQRPYNYYNAWGALIGAYVVAKLTNHYVFKTEYDMRKQPNPFIPRYIYKIRRQSYVYWEISRLARGLPKTFTYSTWDAKARMMYHVDLQGEMTFEKLNLREERLDLLQNPLLGPILRRKHLLMEDELMIRRANKIAIYYLNLDKKYNLDNYLLQKWITPMDWVRAMWYWVSIKTGYADTYRNEQFLPKSDIWYNHERKMLAINMQNPDLAQKSTNLLIALSHEIKEWL